MTVLDEKMLNEQLSDKMENVHSSTFASIHCTFHNLQLFFFMFHNAALLY